MKIAIVTDSTCDWAAEEYAEKGVVMVPLKIQIDDETFLDQVEISSESFYSRMEAAADIPKTSQPSPGDFAAVYNDLVDRGYEAIVSMHLAPILSGTFVSAEMAAKEMSVPIAVIDSKNASSSLGLLVEKACELRDAGMPFEEVVDTVRALTAKTHLYLAPESTENLVKGGRLAEDQAQGAAMLNIKLVFKLDGDGKLVACDKVKGSKGIIKKYVDIVSQLTEEYGPLRLRFMHARNEGEVRKVIEALRSEGIDFTVSGIDSCGATVATHAGIGVIGIALAPANG